MILVLDSSPLITLARIASHSLLRQLADHIVIPEAVYAECVSLAAGRPGSSEIAQADWITHRTVANRAQVKRLHTRIGLARIPQQTKQGNGHFKNRLNSQCLTLLVLNCAAVERGEKPSWW